MTTQGERLAILQRAANYPTLADFARAAGIEPGTARQQANRGSIPADAAAKYAAAARRTGASAEWLLFGTGQGPRNVPAERFASQDDQQTLPLPARRRSVQFPIAAAAPPTVLQHRPDVPVWASAAAGDEDGTIILTDSPIDFIYRTEAILNVPKPFAFYIVGESMEERFFQGDQAVVNPSLPVESGDDCVFIHHSDEGVIYALVKQLQRSTADHWRVKQFNPSRTFDLSKKKWTRAYSIVETRHRRR